MEGFHTYGVDAGGYFGVAAVLDGSGEPPAPLAGELISMLCRSGPRDRRGIAAQPGRLDQHERGGFGLAERHRFGRGRPPGLPMAARAIGLDEFHSHRGRHLGQAFTTPPLGVGDIGAQFRVVVSVVTPVPKSAASSVTMAQSVTSGSATPVLVADGSLNGTSGGLLFNEGMDASPLTNPANYTVSGAVILSATPAVGTQLGCRAGLRLPAHQQLYGHGEQPKGPQWPRPRRQ